MTAPDDHLEAAYEERFEIASDDYDLLGDDDWLDDDE